MMKQTVLAALILGGISVSGSVVAQQRIEIKPKPQHNLKSEAVQKQIDRSEVHYYRYDAKPQQKPFRVIRSEGMKAQPMKEVK